MKKGKSILNKLPVLLLGFGIWDLGLGTCLAQQTVVSGKVTDASSNLPLPFVNLWFPGTAVGTSSDFEGKYSLSTSLPVDSISASFVGYENKTKPVKRNAQQVLHFQLAPAVNQLQEVVVVPGENPAWRIMRNVIRNKNLNDKRALDAYEFESYNKIEISIDNMTDRFLNKKLVRKVMSQVYEQLQEIAGEDGKPVLPVFISETISRYYFRSSPQQAREDIAHTKITGVAIEDGSLVSQIIGTSFQQYNFYQNWLNILTQDFVSPISDGWRIYYRYYLEDSMYIGGHWCYQIRFRPRQPEDLAFAGVMWIADTSFALQRIDATIGKQANLNFIEKIKIQQDLEPSSQGPWLPVKTRVMVDIAQVQDQWAGALVKFYTSNRDFTVNRPHEPRFYEEPIVLAADARAHNNDEDFWNRQRHDTLTESELHVYRVIDTLRNLPVIKTYVDIIQTMINGYITVGKVDLGPFPLAWAYNWLEFNRFRAGFRTNYSFSKRWIYKTYLAYGTGDKQFKYGGSIRWIPSLNPRTEAGISRKYDIRQVGLDEDIDNALFLTFATFSVSDQPYYSEENKVWFSQEFSKDFTAGASLKTFTFDPSFRYDTIRFNYCPGGDNTCFTRFNTAEGILELRYARDELFLQNDNERISLGTKKWPIVTLRYTRGFKDLLQSDFDYHKVTLSLKDNFRMGPFGMSYWWITGGRIFSQVPYPLLEVHLGNETPFYNWQTFNLMNYFEFVSDRFLEIRYEHHFGGLFTNRIPLMRKWEWRNVGTLHVVYGALGEENRTRINQDIGEKREMLLELKAKPYVEFSYGIENILRFFRIEAFHRLTYTDKDKYPRANNFGLKASVYFQL